MQGFNEIIDATHQVKKNTKFQGINVSLIYLKDHRQNKDPCPTRATETREIRSERFGNSL